MDLTGFGKDGKHNYQRDYKINRALTDQERANRLKLDRQASTEPMDGLSVIKLNSTYLELVDRWYPVRGFAAWQGAMILLLGLIPFVAFLWLAINDNDLGGWVFFYFDGKCAFVLYLGWLQRHAIRYFSHDPLPDPSQPKNQAGACYPAGRHGFDRSVGRVVSLYARE
ncbi:hypothetical protein [Luteimonas abyssi]|uniref:hypothetical protein n=1 Tax=Luteimonas abyssi TaxID=1247514 RepID=UPI0012FB4AD8|nr:hypothetical protein [Luteimonas abyssi]